MALGVHRLGIGDAVTSTAAVVYLPSRVLHAAIHTFGIPLLRTLAFAAGFCCEVAMGLRLLGAA